MIISKVVSLNNPYEITFQTEKLDDNALNDNAVLCETLVSAISPGTEIAAYIGAAALRPGKIYPRLMGYCNVARVLRTGRNVSNLTEGDRVLTFSSHRSHFIVDISDVLALIPKEVSSQDAACTYLYHLGYDALLKTNACYGSPIVILGLGVLGLGAAALAVQSGAIVYCISNQEKNSNIALELGVRQVFSRNNVSELSDKLGKRLSDVVITTSNSWTDWEISLMLAGQNASIAVLGFPGRDGSEITINPLDSQYFYSKQLHIQAVGLSPEYDDSRSFLKFNEKNNIAFLLDQIRAGKLDPSFFISKQWNYSEIKNAYDNLVSRENSPITYTLLWTE